MGTNNVTEEKAGYINNNQDIEIRKLKIEVGLIGQIIGTKNPEMCTLVIALVVILVIVIIFSYHGKFDAIENFILPSVWGTIGFLTGSYLKGKKK